MKLLLLLFLMITVVTTSAQYKIAYGNVKADPAFNCKKNRNVTIREDTLLQNICNSKNEMEIRLEVFSMPHGGSQLIIFSFNAGKWQASKYNYSFGKASYQQKPSNDTMYNHLYETTFDSLEMNGIFSLPNQRELGVPYMVEDGVSYSISYKVGNKFRQYACNNMDFYQRHYPTIKELLNYSNIVNSLMKLFD